MLQTDYILQKNRIARSFSLAARSYDAHAALQRKIATILLAQLGKQCNKESIKRILDLGSGTGYCTEALHRLFPDAEIISLDIAEAMLGHARGQHIGKDIGEKYICADAENLPFHTASFDIVFSSLSIQWCQNYTALFSELKRVLLPAGNVFIATFGPETLQELKQAWQQVDSYVHVNRFQAIELLQNKLCNKEFKKINIQAENMIVYYQGFDELARELKSIGAHNVNAGQGRGLSGRNKISKLKNTFEKNSTQHAGIPVTYQVYYLSAVA